ncbi:MAG: DUF5717 family protein [Defluviitaleaceae bacterium]|nr:DUF5717 family protein [Defluviitaleaceae bacterium]MCL2274883.1 DUF5717 family protein [Defluviitaleaceae bacterium]
MNFEQPLPVLDINTEAIELDTKDSATGTITLKNIGGGTLKGYIASRSPAVVFEPDWWEGNTQTLTYTINPSKADIAPGKTLKTVVHICSNGGEASVRIEAKLTKMAITTREGIVIANVRDFYEYTLAYPIPARQIFTDSEFYMLLLAVGYPYMEVYESLHKDANRERAMDNFFILSGLKTETTLALPRRSFIYDQSHGDEARIFGQIIAEKSDKGFFEAPITMENNPPWLSLTANRLISSDFDNENRARVNFSVDPTLIKGRYARECIKIGGNEAEIIFRRPLAITARLNREAYRFDDKGVIEIFNHSGGDLAVEVFCPDNYVRFAARTYSAGKYYEIPFTIKLSAFMNAGRLFRKTPYMRTSIEIKGASPGKVYKIRLPIVVGEW